MPDWTNYLPDPGSPPPGAVNPPPPDQIQPTDPGWSTFVRQQTDKTGLKWTPDCAVSLEVAKTGRTIVWPVSGDNPTGYAAGTDWGWKEDRTYETQPPEPYQDFTRWVRHYPSITTQKYFEIKATVYVRCGTHFVNAPPVFFWVPDGGAQTGQWDAFCWTKTSGLATDADHKTYKWTTTGKKTPPPAQSADPDASWLEPNETPPYWITHDFGRYELGPLKWDLKFRYEWEKPRALQVDPGSVFPKWWRIKEVF